MTYPNLPPAELAMAFGIGDLRRRIQFYHVTGTMLVFVLLVLGLWATADPNHPVLTIPVAATAGDPTTNMDVDARPQGLATRIFPAPVDDKEATTERRNVVLVAVSGGGTRAALYGASVFEGLQSLNALEDVVLYSGVSGGSAAVAYLQIHRDELVEKNCKAQWNDFYEVMSAPFIDDVLRGIVEWRLMGETRMSALLAESFGRRMAPIGRVSSFTMGQCHDTVILNTTLAASRVRTSDGTWTPLSPQNAGGRLIFANINNGVAFPIAGDRDAPDEFLKYVIVDDSNVDVTTAAACSATFPPGFPNVGIVIDDNEEHWVTDGGAADNRGIESLLYSLRQALRDQMGKAVSFDLPRIHIIVAEASAFSTKYSQDRGIGSTFGASQKFASQLMVELLEDCRAAYGDLAMRSGLDAQSEDEGIMLHYLAMPSFFRSKVGIGTNWMLPASVTFYPPDTDSSREQRVTVSGKTASLLIRALHHPERFDELLAPASEMPEVMSRIRNWIDENKHRAESRRLCDKLNAS